MYNGISVNAFDVFFYETMYLMFALVGFIYRIFATVRFVYFSKKKTFLKKILYIKNILKKIFKKSIFTIFFVFCNFLSTILFFSIVFYRNFRIFLTKSLEFRKEIVEENKYYDEFGGDENFFCNYYANGVSI